MVRANETRAPAPVDDVLAPGQAVPDDAEWRVVTATGTYDAADTVIVRYRTRDGASGVDAVVPLVTGDGTALLVDRGWLQTEGSTIPGPADVPAPPAGEVTVTGWVRADGTGGSTRGRTTSRPGRSPAWRSARRSTARCTAGSSSCARRTPSRSRPLEPVELPELDNGPTSSTGSSGGSSECSRSSVSATSPTTSASAARGASEPAPRRAASKDQPTTGASSRN